MSLETHLVSLLGVPSTHLKDIMAAKAMTIAIKKEALGLDPIPDAIYASLLNQRRYARTEEFALHTSDLDVKVPGLVDHYYQTPGYQHLWSDNAGGGIYQKGESMVVVTISHSRPENAPHKVSVTACSDFSEKPLPPKSESN